MTTIVSQIEELVARDEISESLQILREKLPKGDLSNEIIMHQAEYERLEKDARRGLIDESERLVRRSKLAFAVLELVQKVDSDSSDTIRDVPHRSVFISFSSSDREIANQIKEFLTSSGISVRIDSDTQRPGENIRSFIERSVRETNTTVSVVSNRSLVSDWVALESVESFYCEKYVEQKRFVACYIDDDFLSPSFRLSATKSIDARIEEIDNLIPQYREEKLDTNDINEIKTRLFTLRNQLGDIIKRLRDSLCLDIRGDNFAVGMERLAKEILR